MTASFEQNAAARDTLLASEDKLFTHYQERSKDADSFTWAQTFPRLLLKVRRKVGGKEPNIPRALANFKRDLKMDLSLLSAVSLFLSKVTLSDSILKSFDENFTFFCNKILFSPIKLPSFAETYIFCDGLLIAKRGSVISMFDTTKLF